MLVSPNLARGRALARASRPLDSFLAPRSYSGRRGAGPAASFAATLAALLLTSAVAIAGEWNGDTSKLCENKPKDCACSAVTGTFEPSFLAECVQQVRACSWKSRGDRFTAVAAVNECNFTVRVSEGFAREDGSLNSFSTQLDPGSGYLLFPVSLPLAQVVITPGSGVVLPPRPAGGAVDRAARDAFGLLKRRMAPRYGAILTVLVDAEIKAALLRGRISPAGWKYLKAASGYRKQYERTFDELRSIQEPTEAELQATMDQFSDELEAASTELDDTLAAFSKEPGLGHDIAVRTEAALVAPTKMGQEQTEEERARDRKALEYLIELKGPSDSAEPGEPAQ
jgi:hypothetical protein